MINFTKIKVELSTLSQNPFTNSYLKFQVRNLAYIKAIVR